MRRFLEKLKIKLSYDPGSLPLGILKRNAIAMSKTYLNSHIHHGNDSQ
jgi:hypothetical protein